MKWETFTRVAGVGATLTKNFDLERIGASEDVSERFGFTMSPANLRVRLNARA